MRRSGPMSFLPEKQSHLRFRVAAGCATGSPVPVAPIWGIGFIASALGLRLSLLSLRFLCLPQLPIVLLKAV